MADRRAVPGPVPGGLDAEEFAERRHLAGHRKPPDLGDVNSDEVDQPLGDQGNVFLLCVEQLAHRQRNARLAANQPEVVFLLGGQGILQEKQVILLQLLAEVDGLAGRDTFVNVVKQLHLLAERRCADVRTTWEACVNTARAPRSISDRSARYCLARRARF